MLERICSTSRLLVVYSSHVRRSESALLFLPRTHFFASILLREAPNSTIARVCLLKQEDLASELEVALGDEFRAVLVPREPNLESRRSQCFGRGQRRLSCFCVGPNPKVMADLVWSTRQKQN
jgi:hypothetical protein